MKQRTRMPSAGMVTMGGVGFAYANLGMPQFGASAAGPRLERMKRSPNFSKGKARNLVPRPMADPGTSMAAAILRFFLGGQRRKPEVEIPLIRPTRRSLLPRGQRLRATWLGHSTVLLEVDGQILLTDPMFGERSSPFPFAGPRRFHPPPLLLGDLPQIDAVILSHDHYDHLDHGTIVALARQSPRFFVPLGVGAHLESWGVNPASIAELDWWEETELGPLRLACTPAHHFSGRRMFDRNGTLWSSWAIVGPEHRVWFGGDTGPLDIAPQIGQCYGPFDLTMLEVGAHAPEWGSIHLGPDAAAALHRQVMGRTMLPVHWGTFNLALHDWDAPILRLLELAATGDLALLAPLPGQTADPAQARVADFWKCRGSRDQRNGIATEQTNGLPPGLSRMFRSR